MWSKLYVVTSAINLVLCLSATLAILLADKDEESHENHKTLTKKKAARQKASDKELITLIDQAVKKNPATARKKRNPRPNKAG